MEQMVNDLETKILNYRAKKEELQAKMSAELAPIWADVQSLQAEIKAAKTAEKKAKRIAYLKEQLAELEG